MTTNTERAAEVIYSYMSSWDDEAQATNAAQALTEAGLLMPDNDLVAIAVVGVTRQSARDFAEDKRLPEPRVYLSTRDPLGGLICAAVIYTPEAQRLTPERNMEEARRQVIRSIAPGLSIGTSNVNFGGRSNDQHSR